VLDSTPACDEVTQVVCKDGLGGNREVQPSPVLVHSGTSDTDLRGRAAKRKCACRPCADAGSESRSEQNRQSTSAFQFLKQRLEVNFDMTTGDRFSLAPCSLQFEVRFHGRRTQGRVGRQDAKVGWPAREGIKPANPPDYPSETFRVLKEMEIRLHGEYRTRRLVLQAWDRMEAEGVFTILDL
jgi:hypothetical protein